MGIHKDTTVITGALIWPGSGPDAKVGDVAVAGNRIVGVSDQVGSLVAGSARVIDGRGQTLMPGLVEGHAHIAMYKLADYKQFVEVKPEEHILNSLENARLLLDHGFTSAYSAGSANLRQDVVIRNAVNEGRWPGPRLRACSPTLTTTGGLGDERVLHEDRAITGLVADGPDEMRRAVRLAAREDADNIKINMTGEIGGIPTNIPPGRTTILEIEVAAAMEAAKVLERSICVHARNIETVMMALKYGADVIYHADLIDEATMDAMGEARDRVMMGPALAVFHEFASLGPAMPMYDFFASGLERLAGVTRQLHDRGVDLVIGGDYGGTDFAHGTNARDISHMVTDVGLAPYQALECATRNGGRIMRLPNELGQVKEGYLADLLLVKGLPLEDVTVLQDKDNLSMIMKDGEMHKAPTASTASVMQPELVNT